MDELEYSFKPTGQISVFNIKPNYSITFLRNENGVTGKEVGKFDFNGPKMVFTGDAEESAKVFIDWVARSFHGRLEEERKAAQPAVQEPFGYVYEVYCLPECAWEMDWVEIFDRYEPDAEDNIRNVIPLYTTPPAAAVPDALNPKDENPAYAAGWNDCRAEMLKGMKP